MSKWKCPCQGCGKARQQVLDEILEIINSGGDSYYRMHLVFDYIRKNSPKKKKETTPPVG